MQSVFQSFVKRFTPVVAAVTAVLACAGQNPMDLVGQSTVDYSGYIVVTTVATDPATGAGLSTLFDPRGRFVRTIQDYFSTTEFPTGSAFVPPDRLIVSVDGADRLELWNLTVPTLLMPITHSGLSSTTQPLHQIARDPVDGSIYVAEATPNTVEKFTLNPDGSYSRAGNPFIATTVGTCVLAGPWGITVIPGTQRVAVISFPSTGAAGRLSIYDKDGNCITHTAAAPFNAGTPNGIAYHEPSNKLIVSFATSHALWAFNADGTNGAQIFLNATIISTPRAVATDKAGYIYVTSSGTDTIEKLSYTGSGSATRALPGPLIGPGITSQNPTSVMVIP